MFIFFYVHNSNGKDSLDLWPCSQQTEEGGGGERQGNCKLSCIYKKNRPFVASSYITVFKILSTATLNENLRIFFLKKEKKKKKNYTYLRKNSLQTTALYLQFCDQLAWTVLCITVTNVQKSIFFSDHKTDTDLKISNTFHNTFPKQALKCDKYKGLIFFLENPFLIKSRIR